MKIITILYSIILFNFKHDLVTIRIGKISTIDQYIISAGGTGGSFGLLMRRPTPLQRRPPAWKPTNIANSFHQGEAVSDVGGRKSVVDFCIARTAGDIH